ncbi:LysM domain-containing protein [Kosakonia sp. MUSA4]|uniref:LysM peptidoglycan-binding domain-containing protein n=1 Tax=Kosakonia sp. MUSA4 TaxID=2067958 RepID=UPI00159A9AD1|nr:LysM domain-containing protein [Kosakonia sp. MUSA4]QJT80690.1 glycosyl hydrolase [Kosakonia sp. MUSA4]
MPGKKTRNAPSSIDTPIQNLWNTLLSAGYLSADQKKFNLPAANALHSAPVSALLNDADLFPAASLVMTLSGVQPPGDGNTIVLTGQIDGNSFNVSQPAASATFSVTANGVAQLSVSTHLPDNSAVLGTAFPGLKPHDKKHTVSAAAITLFRNAVFTASSSDAGTGVTFSGQPVAGSSYQGMWKTHPAAMQGNITQWPTKDRAQSPAFVLRSEPVDAVPAAGLLPLKAGLLFVSSQEDNDTSHGIATFDAGTLALSGIELHFPLLDDGDPLALSNDSLAVSLSSIADIASLLMGEVADALLPNRFPLGTDLLLQELAFTLDITASRTLQVSATVKAHTEIHLLPLNLAVLESVIFTFSVGVDLSAWIAINGLFKLNGQEQLRFYGGLSFSVPGGSDSVTLMAYNDAEIDILQLLNIVPGLPTLPESGIITPAGGLSAQIQPATGAWLFSGTIAPKSGAWTLEFGRGIKAVSLKSLRLDLERTPTNLTATIQAHTEFLGIPFIVSAQTSTQSKAWIFEGRMIASKPVSLISVASQLLPFIPQSLPTDITLNALQVKFNTAANTFMVQTTLQWTLDFLPISITADLLIRSDREKASDPASYSGQLTGIVDINNMILTCSYIFSPTTTDIIFAYRNLKVVYHKDDTDPYVAVSLEKSNVGDLFAFLLSFAQPGRNIALGEPWNALEKISLPNLTVNVHLKTRKINVSIGLNVDLGFIKITQFTLTYVKQYGKPKFNLELSCEFLGQRYGGDNKPLSWDPLNQAPPVVPGAGTQVFDLEYLGIGQRMTLRGEMPTTMDGVIKRLENALIPVGNPTRNPANQLPGLSYDAGSEWMIGTRFTAMSTVSLSMVFNDPRVYGLLIQLAGSRAGPLAGLRFEILYRKISDNVGVYHIELTLPDTMRHLEFGEVSITLPIVTVDIFTNGNFRIDAGFPPSLTDFSRSFSVQVFPFIGYGGFYFGVLNGETSTTIPRISNGNFTPVIEFGFALQVGVGKTLSLGILSGGISITVGGMLQGTLSWFNPIDQALVPENYFHLRGALAVIGQVYATVDFGIIQASVSLTIYVSAAIDVESYRAILLSVSAGVRVKVSIKIIFIRINFSFSATITETFPIGSNRQTPWILSAPTSNTGVQRSLYRAKSPFIRQPQYGQLRLRPARTMMARHILSRYRHNAGAPLCVNVTAIPLFSQAIADDFAFSGAPTVPFAGKNPVLALLLGIETSTDAASGTNQLLSFMSDWLSSLIGDEHATLSAAVVDEILDALKAPDAITDIFSYTNLVHLFDNHHIQFTLQPRPQQAQADGSELPMALMAMIPELSLETPDYTINFLTDRIPAAGYEQRIQDYFAELAAQFAERQGWNSNKTQDASQPDSMARLIFRYYFLMVARSLLQQTKSFMAEAEWPLSEKEAAHASLQTLANRFNNNYTVRAGEDFPAIAARFSVTPQALEAANPQFEGAAPAAGDTLFIPAPAVSYIAQPGDTLESLAACFALEPDELQQANPQVNFHPLAGGTQLAIPAMRILHKVLDGEVAATIAAEFGLSLQALRAANPQVNFNPLKPGTLLLIPLTVSPYAIAESNQQKAGKLRAGTLLPLGDIPFLTQNGDTFASLAARFGANDVALVASNQNVQGLLRAAQKLPLGDFTWTSRDGDSLNGVIAYWYARNTDFNAQNLLADNPTLRLAAQQTLNIPQLNENDKRVTLEHEERVQDFLLANSTTLDVLIASNNAITLATGQTLQLKNIVVVASNSFLLQYTAGSGETPLLLAQRFFEPSPAAQAAALLSIRQWNGNIAAESPFATGSLVVIPYFTTPGNICRQFGITLAELCRRSTLLSDSNLLAANVSLLAAQVTHRVVANETLAEIAQNYNLSLEQLTGRIATLGGLFADEAKTLAVKAIPGFRRSLLARVLAQTGSYTNALNMSTRFMLNGLRLPDPDFPQQGSLAINTPAAYPLYALVGQEYPLAPPDAQKGYTLTLTGSDAGWINIPDGKLVIPLLAEEIARIAELATAELDTANIVSQAIPLYSWLPDRQTVSATAIWATEEVPEGITLPSQRVNTPRIWSMPDALIRAIAESPDRRLPYRGCFGTPLPDGNIDTTALQAARYATAIDFTIEKPDASRPGMYLLSGTDQAGLQRVLNLWSYLKNNDAVGATLYLAYREQQASNSNGTQTSDRLDRANSFLLKTNLSTESHGEFQTLLRANSTVMLNDGLIDASLANLTDEESRNFLQLLWECSVVKNGGYYLYYQKEDGTPGLPGSLFSDGKQASLQLIVLLSTQTADAGIARSFNNILIVGDNVDQSANSIFFEAATHTVVEGDTLNRIAANAPPILALSGQSLGEINQLIMGVLRTGSEVAGQIVLPSDSISAIALRAGKTVAEIVAALADRPAILRTGARLMLAGKPVQPVKDGDTLATIASEYDFLDPAALVALNAHRTPLLAEGASFNLPGGERYILQAGDTFFSIAQAKQQDLSLLGDLNATAPILLADTVITVAANTLKLCASLPPGHAGFMLQRNNPQVESAAETTASALGTLYNLAGFQLAANATLNASNEGLPAGPTNDTDESLWQYRQILSLIAFARNKSSEGNVALPSAAQSPYRAVSAGGQADITLCLQDILGNRTVGSSLPTAHSPTGYTDELLGPGAWPSVNTTYRFQPRDGGGALAVTAQLSATPFLPDASAVPVRGGLPSGKLVTAAASRAQQARLQYQTASWQLQQPDITARLSTTLGELDDNAALSLALRYDLLGLANSAWIFTGIAAGIEPTRITLGPETALKNFADVLSHYPASGEMVAKINQYLRADLLFGAATPLIVPHNVLTKAGDTPQAVIDHLEDAIDLTTLGRNNMQLAVAVDTVFSTATRSVVLDVAGQSLNALALSFGCAIATSAGNVPGMAATCQLLALGNDVVLSWSDPVSGNSWQYGPDAGENRSLAAAAAWFAQQIKASQRRENVSITVDDVAVENQFVNGIFARGQTLSIASVIAHSGDTIASLLADFGAPQGKQNDPLADFMAANANVPNVWPISTALYIEDTALIIEEGQTLEALAQQAAISAGSLIANNLHLPFNRATSMLIPFSGDNQEMMAGSLLIASGQPLSALASALAMSSRDLLTLNETLPALFSGSPIGSITPALSDTPQDLARGLAITVGELADRIADDAAALRSGALLVTPAVQSRESETIKAVALRLNCTAEALIAANACLPGWITAGQSITVDGAPYLVRDNDTLALLLARINEARLSSRQPPLSTVEFAAVAQDLSLSARAIITPVVILQLSAQVRPYAERAIQNLGVSLAISRDPTMMAAGFDSAPLMVSSTTSITAAPFSASDNLQSLTQFAIDFENAFSGLKLATGPQQTQGNTLLKQASMRAAVNGGATQSKEKSLWVANFSDRGSYVNYAVDAQSARYFALPPLTTLAWNGNAQQVSYSPQQGLEWGSGTTAFRAADPEQWQQQLFSAIDLVLSPEYAVAGANHPKTRAAIQQVITAKQQIANGVAQRVQPIISGDNQGQTEAINAMEQQLLVALSSASTVQSLIQLDLNVTGDGAPPTADIATAPQLSGKLTTHIVNTQQIAADNDAPLVPLAEMTGVSPRYLATLLATTRNIIRPDLTIARKDQPDKICVTSASDTLSSIAQALELPLYELAGNSKILGTPQPLFLHDTAINVTPTTAPQTLTTLTSVASWANTTLAEVIVANQQRTDFFSAGSTLTLGYRSFTPSPGDTLEKIALFFGDVETFATQLGSVDAGSLSGHYQLNDSAPPRGLTLVPQISLSTAKVALAQGITRLTTAFGVKDPMVQRNVTLQLAYQVNQLEFDRHGIAGVHGYQDSSWLSFIIPLENVAHTDGQIGQLQIPVPLSSYPQPAVVSRQTASAATPAENAVATLAQWDYAFTATRQFAAQDQATFEILFNQPDDGVSSPLVRDSRYEPIITLLAAFSTVWDAIASDLAQLKDATQQAIPLPAINALNGLASFAQKIGDAWANLRSVAPDLKGLPTRRYLYLLSILTPNTPTEISSISLERLEQRSDFGSEPDDFLFTCSAAFAADLDKRIIPAALETRMAECGFPPGAESYVTVGTPGSDWMIYAPQATQRYAGGKTVTAPQTFRLQRKADEETILLSRQILWPAIDTGAGQRFVSHQMGNRLIYDLPQEGLPISDLLTLPMVFYRLNIMGLQDAWGGTSIARNANLLAGKRINPDFIYQTPLAMFPTRISPLLADTTVTTLAGETLEEALATLFQTLTAGQAAILGASHRAMRIAACWWSGADPSQDPLTTPLRVSTPLTLSPLYAFDVASDWKTGHYISRLAQQMQKQATALGVTPRAPGRWVVDILIYSYQENQNAKALTALLDIRNKTYQAS